MKRGVAAILIVLVLPTTGFAQRQSDAGSSGGVGGIAITVDLARSRPEQAFNRAASQPQPSVHHGHPVLIGAAVGAGAGYVLNATACRTGESVCTVPGNLLLAGIGAGIGAVIGVLISRR